MARVKDENGTHSYADYSTDFMGGLKEKFSNFKSTDVHKVHEQMWSKSSLFCGIGFVAFIVWVFGAILKLAIPSKWFLYGLIGTLSSIGKIVFLICAFVMLLLLAIGLFFKFADWLKQTRW